MNNELATEKQLKFMKQLGLETPPAMSKDTAKERISEHLESGDKKAESKPSSKGEFHLTPEQVRSNALSSAITHFGTINYTINDLMAIAKDFEQFILGKI